MMSRLRKGLLAVVVLAIPDLSGAAPPPSPSLRVRATEAMAPCVTVAAQAFASTGGRGASVETGDLNDRTADVLVGSGPEMTRALESGLGRDDSDVAIAEVPWVLVLSDAVPTVASLEDAVRAGLEVDVLAGPASYEARRVLVAKSSRVWRAVIWRPFGRPRPPSCPSPWRDGAEELRSTYPPSSPRRRWVRPLPRPRPPKPS
jgi:hypothetical protein